LRATFAKLPVLVVVKRNLFRDSIQLMRLTEEAKKLPGVDDAVLAMGTTTNRRLLQDMGLLAPETKGAGDGDLVLAIRTGEGAGAEVLARVEQLVMSPPPGAGGPVTHTFHSLRSALEQLPEANLAVVSVPGSQAFEPSMELLRNGVSVQLFSDHVPYDQEKKLKAFASVRGLLVLGPGAGTSIINGVGLGFANNVRRGNIGIVASAGTGIQEASVLLDRIGLGVSQALGVGGSDASEEVGGVMMKDSLGLLQNDKDTRVIMVIAKTPTDRVMRRMMGYVEKRTTKPVVACFLGLDNPPPLNRRIRYAKTLHSAVSRVAQISGGKAPKEFGENISSSFEGLRRTSKKLASRLTPRQKYVRAVYSGGTFAHETLLIFRELMGEAYSNTPLSSKFSLKDPNLSKQNSVIDMGDEFFTSGRAHPMIDSTLRRLRIAKEANDPSVAVIMLDIVLGLGSSPDPGGSFTQEIKESKQQVGGREAEFIVMAHVCGTDADPQSQKEQSEKLSKAGAILFSSNALMASAAALVVGGDDASARLKAKWGELLA
jgi:succinyl-CoA synthetase alpha subunit